ncbi:MAG TPA: SEC-C metal-binding domain-containing protein [Acidimicrobiia bacterium]
MVLDRGMLARIDRRVFTELNHSDGVQVVKVPVSDAVWSSWRRYCDVLDVTMGQAVAGLISHELAAVVDEAPERAFDLQRASQERADRLEAWERELDDRASQLRRIEHLLRDREARLQRKSAVITGARTVVKVGRNEPCPCGSGLKYMRCHGLQVPGSP